MLFCKSVALWIFGLICFIMSVFIVKGTINMLFYVGCLSQVAIVCFTYSL